MKSSIITRIAVKANKSLSFNIEYEEEKLSIINGDKIIFDGSIDDFKELGKTHIFFLEKKTVISRLIRKFPFLFNSLKKIWLRL